MEHFAEHYFIQRKGNCAQAVCAAWGTFAGDSDHTAESFRSYGSGKAPDGLCGALYAACIIAGENRSEELKSSFAEATGGHLLCRDIRQAQSMRCPDCVKLAAQLLKKSTTRTIL